MNQQRNFYLFIFKSTGVHQGPCVESLRRRKRRVQRRGMDQVHRDVHRGLEYSRLCWLWRNLRSSRFTGKALCKSSRRILKYCSGEWEVTMNTESLSSYTANRFGSSRHPRHAVSKKVWSKINRWRSLKLISINCVTTCLYIYGQKFYRLLYWQYTLSRGLHWEDSVVNVMNFFKSIHVKKHS